MKFLPDSRRAVPSDKVGSRAGEDRADDPRTTRAGDVGDDGVEL